MQLHGLPLYGQRPNYRGIKRTSLRTLQHRLPQAQGVGRGVRQHHGEQVGARLRLLQRKWGEEFLDDSTCGVLD